MKAGFFEDDDDDDFCQGSEKAHADFPWIKWGEGEGEGEVGLRVKCG